MKKCIIYLQKMSCIAASDRLKIMQRGFEVIEEKEFN